MKIDLSHIHMEIEVEVWKIRRVSPEGEILSTIRTDETRWVPIGHEYSYNLDERTLFRPLAEPSNVRIKER